jgi:hypothetical protein
VTQREFDDFPLCLKAWHVKRTLGVSDEGVRTLRDTVPGLVVHQFGKKGMWLYSKEKVAELAKLKFV